MATITFPQCVILIVKKDYNNYINRTNILVGVFLHSLFGIFLLSVYLILLPIFLIGSFFWDYPILCIMFVCSYTLFLSYVASIFIRGAELFRMYNIQRLVGEIGNIENSDRKNA